MIDDLPVFVTECVSLYIDGKKMQAIKSLSRRLNQITIEEYPDKRTNNFDAAICSLINLVTGYCVEHPYTEKDSSQVEALSALKFLSRCSPYFTNPQLFFRCTAQYLTYRGSLNASCGQPKLALKDFNTALIAEQSIQSSYAYNVCRLFPIDTGSRPTRYEKTHAIAALHSNIAAVQSQLGHYHNAIENCHLALKAINKNVNHTFGKMSREEVNDRIYSLACVISYNLGCHYECLRQDRNALNAYKASARYCSISTDDKLRTMLAGKIDTALKRVALRVYPDNNKSAPARNLPRGASIADPRSSKLNQLARRASNRVRIEQRAKLLDKFMPMGTYPNIDFDWPGILPQCEGSDIDDSVYYSEDLYNETDFYPIPRTDPRQDGFDLRDNYPTSNSSYDDSRYMSMDSQTRRNLIKYLSGRLASPTSENSSGIKTPKSAALQWLVDTRAHLPSDRESPPQRSRDFSFGNTLDYLNAFNTITSATHSTVAEPSMLKTNPNPSNRKPLEATELLPGMEPLMARFDYANRLKSPSPVRQTARPLRQERSKVQSSAGTPVSNKFDITTDVHNNIVKPMEYSSRLNDVSKLRMNEAAASRRDTCAEMEFSVVDLLSNTKKKQDPAILALKKNMDMMHENTFQAHDTITPNRRIDPSPIIETPKNSSHGAFEAPFHSTAATPSVRSVIHYSDNCNGIMTTGDFLGSSPASKYTGSMTNRKKTLPGAQFINDLSQENLDKINDVPLALLSEEEQASRLEKKLIELADHSVDDIVEILSKDSKFKVLMQDLLIATQNFSKERSIMRFNGGSSTAPTSIDATADAYTPQSVWINFLRQKVSARSRTKIEPQESPPIRKFTQQKQEHLHQQMLQMSLTQQAGPYPPGSHHQPSSGSVEHLKYEKPSEPKPHIVSKQIEMKQPLQILENNPQQRGPFIQSKDMLADPLKSIIELTTASTTENLESTNVYSTQQSALIGSRVRDTMRQNMEISVADDCRISLKFTKK